MLGDIKFNKEVSEMAKDLCKQIMNPNLERRCIDPAEILAHPWLNKVPLRLKVFKDDQKFKMLKQEVFNEDFDLAEEGNIVYLESTLNEEMRNITEESIVKCPYNSTEEAPFDKRRSKPKLKAVLYKNKDDIISFEPRIKQFDIRYEKENNQKFDDGVYVTTQQSGLSRSRSGVFSQISRTRTFTTKRDSTRKSNVTKQRVHHLDEDNKMIFNQFGEEGVQEVSLDEKSKIQLDYNLVYALRRFGYPYEYTIRCMLTKEINYCSAFLELVKKPK